MIGCGGSVNTSVDLPGARRKSGSIQLSSCSWFQLLESDITKAFKEQTALR